MAAWDNRTLHEHLTEDHFERLQKELQDGDDGFGSDSLDEDDASDSEMFMVHTPGSGIIELGYARAVIGEYIVKELEEATGGDRQVRPTSQGRHFQGLQRRQECFHLSGFEFRL